MTERKRIQDARKYAEHLLRELETLEILRGARNPLGSEVAAAAALAFGDDVRLLLLDLRDDYRRRKLREPERKKGGRK
jgi:hypothetical protein